MGTGRLFWTVFLILLTQILSWRHNRVPRVGYKKIRQHKKLVPEYNRKLKSLIVATHNYFRSRVSPAAADMLKMSWDEESARSAQGWSEECRKLEHTPPGGRYTKRFGACGQNILVASHPVPWFFTIESWWLEKDLFTFGAENSIHQVGHYTQLVWNATHKVGCGFNRCANTVTGEKYYSYICNYCPAGNFVNRLSYPYTRGKPCSHCSNDCNKKQTGKLCTNGCPVADFWSNCQELKKDMENECYKDKITWSSNFLEHQNISNSTKYRERCGMCHSKHHLHHCKATCRCKNKLHTHF